MVREDISTTPDAIRGAHMFFGLSQQPGRENLHDLPGVLQTFGKQAEMIFNGQPFTTLDQIAEGHVLQPTAA